VTESPGRLAGILEELFHAFRHMVAGCRWIPQGNPKFPWRLRFRRCLSSYL